jgi:glycosyltransferase involved in cell wall biosynthesis
VKIVANLGVKDEVELIGPAIDHLRAIGVDLVIACDTGSTDGTYEILESLRCDESLWLFRIDDLDPASEETWTRATMALTMAAKAEWTLFLDADEFWIPASGHIKDCCALAEADILSVRRHSIPLAPDGPAMPAALIPERYDDLLLMFAPIPDFSTNLRENAVTSFIRLVDDKIMVRPEHIGTIWPGGHGIHPNGPAQLRRARPSDLVIAHLPLTTLRRFKRKMNNVRKSFLVHEQYFGDGLAWHWRRWLSLADQGRLDQEFNHNVYDWRLISALRAEGVIRSASEMFDDPLTLSTELTDLV